MNFSAGQPPPFVQIDRLNAGFGAKPVLRDLTFDLARGQTLVVLGESGCGKTTLLKTLAGMVPLTAGEIRLETQLVSSQPTNERSIIYLDQEPLLFEHLDVAENIGFALKLRGVPARAMQDEVDRMLTAIDLAGHGRKREGELSGGQKQRVAFARAVLARPKLLLLDEPFCSLDSKTRGQMHSLFADLCRRYALTCLFVTHDVKEALILGDRWARMTDGTLTIYPDRQAFMHDESTGVRAEIDFWRDVAR